MWLLRTSGATCDDDAMADEQTGGMIALIPRAADLEDLVVSGGEDADELHLTLVYLGDDVRDWSSSSVNRVISAVSGEASRLPHLGARVFAHATFNPDGHAGRKPCAVYLVGETGVFDDLRRTFLPHVPGDVEQHQPFFAHITAGYGIPQSRLSHVGDVVFDTLRLALAGEYWDFPLSDLDDPDDPERSVDEMTEEIAEDFAISAELLDQKIMSPDPRAAKLREYWAHGAGRKKWNTFRALRRHLAKYVKNPRMLDGLTANIYKLATGTWPGRRGEKVMSTIAPEEFKAALLLADPDADLDMEPLSAEEEDPEDETTDEEAIYEQALIDDFPWELDGQAKLVPDRDEDGDPDEDDDQGAVPMGPQGGEFLLFQ